MKKLFLICTIMFFAIQPVFSANWKQFIEKSYIDIDSIKPNIDILGEPIPSEYTYWTKELNDGREYFTDMEKYYNKKVWYVLNKEFVNCNKKTMGLQARIIYDLKAQPINSLEISSYEQKANSVVPDSVGELLYNIICAP